MKVLLTGGTGYIGSHTAVELVKSGDEVMIVDNLSNSKLEVLNRIEKITGVRPAFYEVDLRDADKLDQVFQEHEFDVVIHFAGLKAVGESVDKPLEYYDNNINATIVLVQTMLKHGVKKIIFSSSATVYGNPSELPLKETSQVGVGLTNPYGWTKFMIEQILSDVAVANPDFSVTSLRYFNPIGAHDSGLIGEDPSGIPNNLLPYVSQVAVGKLPELNVFGDDYDTPDGTGVRDYIHVVDLVRGHIAALGHMSPGVTVYNLGTGQGVSVLEIVKAFEEASGKPVPYKIVGRRPGDIASCYASAEKALRELGWKTEKTLLEACRDSWNWQSKNPDGYN
ncbi:UDP-glucose 4-epimerase GalE [Candidatus Saccharibacteria bacterium]|nr:UDP-glucose 4-epimerase GalE [Candidatus Saccharibacteria bacterium]